MDHDGLAPGQSSGWPFCRRGADDVYLNHFLQLYDSIDMGDNGVIA